MAFDLRSVSEVFNKVLFRIPDYQRGYSWDKYQLEDFWNDIIVLAIVAILVISLFASYKTNVVIPTNTVIPGLPKTGFPPQEKNMTWIIVALAGVLSVTSITTFMILKKRKM